MALHPLMVRRLTILAGIERMFKKID